MKRIYPILSFCFFVVIGIFGTGLLAAVDARPNIVVLLADDQGWGDLGINGNTNLATPHIDALARAGARLDRFYVCAVCAPTRAEFLAGRYHSRGGVYGVSAGEERLNLDERTIADAFKAAGYATGAFGKWHNGSQWPYHPNARGFDEYYGFTSGHCGEYFDPLLDHNGQPMRGRGYITDDLTSHAIEFIERNRATPFFCYVPFNTPHSPFAVPAEDWARFKDKPIALRGPDGEKEDLAVTRCVLAMCENIDRNVGRILSRLDELELSDNTIVIYFSDNGPNSSRWNGGMKGRKASVDEGGVRAPFVIRWPGKIEPGLIVQQITGAIDLLPTLTALAGIPSPAAKPLDGKDLSPLLLASCPVRDWPDRMLFSHHNGRVSVRSERYRLDPIGALFDMENDPGQRSDVAADRPEIAVKLAAAVAGWRADVFGDETAQAGRKLAAARPFTVGYPEFPLTSLPARDGIPHGEVQRSASAPNASFFTHWQSLADSITWDVEVQTTGDYKVAIAYTCREADVGSRVELSFGDARLTGTVAPAWDPPFATHQDTIPRPAAESPAKEFRELPLGTLRLEKGRGLLTLRALEIAGTAVMDVSGVTLTLVP